MDFETTTGRDPCFGSGMTLSEIGMIVDRLERLGGLVGGIFDSVGLTPNLAFLY
jgi:hypothetical protein